MQGGLSESNGSALLAMSPTYSILGWMGLVVLGLFFAGLIYVDISTRRLLRRAVSRNVNDPDVQSEASVVLGKGFYARVRWLRSSREEGARFTLNVYFACVAAIVVLLTLWAAAMILRP